MQSHLTGIVTKRGPRKYSAHCIELDVNSEGTTVDEAKNKLINAVQEHINHLCETGEKKYIIPKADLTKMKNREDSQVFELPNYLIL